MKALESKVIVRVIKDALKTKCGNLEISESVEDYEVAEVLEVGPKVENLGPGEKVYIYKGSGKTFKIEGKEFRTITVNEIIVVL